nr:carboxymuconolactone decarboxylase family protein [Micromonospora sp. DSM 115978]
GWKGRSKDDTEALRAAYAARRAVLGDAYVDRAAADASGTGPDGTGTDQTSKDFQDYITSMAWGVWSREGALSRRDRSLLVLAMTAALGRMEEFHLHATSAPNAGVTDEEVDELLFQVAAYCGAPAGVSAKRVVRSVRASRVPAA